MHDTSGSKLDGRAKEGRWVGIDEESRGHRIYWPGKRLVTVERSVRFVPDEVNVPLEGEFNEKESFDEVEKETPSSTPIEILAEDVNERAISPIQEAIEEVPEQETIKNDGGRNQRIRKESDYIRRIREGENIVTMPRGLQTVQEQVQEKAGGVWEVQEEDWAMATVMDSVEYLNPTYKEARKQSDWPKWQEAIKVELQNLESNETWTVVERPKDANIVSSKWVLRIKKNAAGEVDKYKA